MNEKVFVLNEAQEYKLRVWLSERQEDLKVYRGAIGGGLTYSFTPTGIGTGCTVTLTTPTDDGSLKKESIDLTEYDLW